MLAMAEYTYNNFKHSATKSSAFCANYRLEPHINWPIEIQFQDSASELYRHYINHIHEKLLMQLEMSIECKRRYYDKQRQNDEQFKKRKWVVLNGKNIRANHHFKKLEDNIYGHFKVLSSGITGTYSTLKLLESQKIHPMFNVHYY